MISPKWDGDGCCLVYSVLEIVSGIPTSSLGFPDCSVVKDLPAKAGTARDASLTPGLVRSPGKGNGNPLQYSCRENPMDRRAWWATGHRVSKSQTQLSDHTHMPLLLPVPFPTPGHLCVPGKLLCLTFKSFLPPLLSLLCPWSAALCGFLGSVETCC